MFVTLINAKIRNGRFIKRTCKQGALNNFMVEPFTVVLVPELLVKWKIKTISKRLLPAIKPTQLRKRLYLFFNFHEN